MVAPLMGPLPSTVQRLRIGASELTVIADGAVIRDRISPPFGLGVEPETIAAVAGENLLPIDKLFNSYTVSLVNTGRELVLIDTGNGSHRTAGGVGFLHERLQQAGYAPEDIDVVAFTHAHPDHIAGVMHLGKPAFPNARYAMGRREYDEWFRGDRIPERRRDSLELFHRLIPPLAERMTFLEPGDDVVSGLRAVEAYGHSLGHLAFNLASEGHEALIWGDTANHFVFSLAHPEWPMAMDDDRDAAIVTRQRILDQVATDRSLVVGFHMPFPGIGYVARSSSGGYRWVPITYQHLV